MICNHDFSSRIFMPNLQRESSSAQRAAEPRLRRRAPSALALFFAVFPLDRLLAAFHALARVQVDFSDSTVTHGTDPTPTHGLQALLLVVLERGQFELCPAVLFGC